MEKFQSACTLAGKREGEGAEWTAPGSEMKKSCWDCCVKGESSSQTAELLQYLTELITPLLHPRPLLLSSVEVCRGHGRAALSGLKSVRLHKYQKDIFHSSYKPEVIICSFASCYLCFCVVISPWKAFECNFSQTWPGIELVKWPWFAQG